MGKSLELLVPIDLDSRSLHEAHTHVVFLLVELYVGNVCIRRNVGRKRVDHFGEVLDFVHIDFTLTAAHYIQLIQTGVQCTDFLELIILQDLHYSQ